MATGVKMLDANVNGKIQANPAVPATSEFGMCRPIQAPTHVIAYAKTANIRKASAASAKPLLIRQPTASPVSERIVITKMF